MSRVQLVTLCLLAAAITARAVFEDQAGQYSWHREYVGEVKQTLFAFKGRDRAFVSTDADVVASINLRQGDIVWRQALAAGDSIDAIALVPKPACIVSLSQQGRHLRAWHAGDGVLLWESFLGGPPSGSALRVLPDVTGDGSSDIAVLAGGKLQVVSGNSGSTVWSVQLPAEWASSQLAVLTVEEQLTLAAVGAPASGEQLEVWLVSARAGEVQSKEEHVLSSPIGGGLTIVGGVAVAVSMQGHSLCSLPLQGGKVRCDKLTGGPIGQLQLLELGAQRAVGVKGDGGIAVVDVSAAGARLISFQKGAEVAAGGLAVAGDEAVVVAGSGDAGTWARLIWISNGGEGEVPIGGAWGPRTVDGNAVGLAHAAVSAKDLSTKAAAQQSVRLLLGAADASLALLEGGRVAWVREEALGSVTGELFLDLPAPSPEAAARWRASAPNLAERVTAEFLALKAQFGAATPAEAAQLAGLQARASSQLLPFRDPNGFRKLILLLTRPGKVFGLHSGDGRQLWALAPPPGRAASHVALWRTSHDAASAPEVLLLGNDAPAGTGFYMTLNAHTGAQLSAGELPFEVAQVIQLGELVHDGLAEQRVYALVSGGAPSSPGAPPAVCLLPDTAAARRLLAAPGRPVHFWHANADTGALEGFALGPDGKASLVWSMALPAGGDSILAHAEPSLTEPVYSYAKVLGDRSLKLKYLNRNTLFLATGTPPGGPAAGARATRVTAHLLDTVTGRVLYSQTHEGANGPVHAVFGENWVVYTYWSSAAHRWQASVMELYDASPRDLSPVHLVLGSSNDTLSSYRPLQLEVLRQDFFLPFGVRALAATATSHGITSRFILFGTLAGQVYMMDKRYLDPRRPVGPPSAEDKAEGLVPYEPELPLAPQLFMTHRHTVANLAGIHAAPASLESTCLTLARGLDLFLSRVQPSKTFDLLPDDFPFALLIAITLAMIGGAIALKVMGEQAMLKQKWD